MDRELEMGLFLNDVKNKLEELTGETIIVERAIKCNGAKWHGVRKAIKKEVAEIMNFDSEDVTEQEDETAEDFLNNKAREIRAVVYLDNAFEDFKAGHITIAEVAERVIKTWEEEEQKERDFDMMWNARYIQNNVCYRLVNYGYNMEMLKEVPHIRFLDLAMVYYVSISLGSGLIGSMIIKNSHLELFGITEEQIYECAKVNTQEMLEGRIVDIADSMTAIAKKLNLGDDVVETYKKQARGKMFVGTNCKGIFGAAVLAYPNLIGDFSKRIDNSDLVIIGSSVHEIIIIPVNDDLRLDEIKEYVMEVNRTQVDWTEVLSDSVYYYDSEKQEVMVV